MGTRIQLCGRLVVEIGGRRVEGELPGRQGRLSSRTSGKPLAPLDPGRAGRGALAGRGAGRGGGVARRAPLQAALDLSVLVAFEGKAELRLALPDEAWIDLEAAGVGVHRAESAVALGRWDEGWAPARTALYVANRRFLPGYEAPWIDERRRWLDDVRLRALEASGRSGSGWGHGARGAERAGRSVVEAALFRESGYRLLMEALEARGTSPRPCASTSGCGSSSARSWAWRRARRAGSTGVCSLR